MFNLLETLECVVDSAFTFICLLFDIGCCLQYWHKSYGNASQQQNHDVSCSNSCSEDTLLLLLLLLLLLDLCVDLLTLPRRFQFAGLFFFCLIKIIQKKSSTGIRKTW